MAVVLNAQCLRKLFVLHRTARTFDLSFVTALTATCPTSLGAPLDGSSCAWARLVCHL